jgi:hypothetical protein
MDNNELLDNEEPKEKIPSTGTWAETIIQIIGVILRLVGFVIVGAVAAFFLTALLFGYNPFSIAENLPLSNKLFILILQGITQLISFILLPLLYIHFIRKDSILVHQTNWNRFGLHAFFAILIMLFSIPLINVLVDFNKSIHLPHFLKNTESWMQDKELEAKKLTELIAYYNNPMEFILGLLVIAVIPAIGEELLFRGIIQNELKQILRNPHLAIWISGFIFSFMHFQFYGFIPRMLLGVMFGYLYFWSGSLLIPILVHFINNGLTFILLNLYRNKVIGLNPESSDSFPVVSIMLSFIVFLFLLLTFKKIGTKKEE